MPAPVAEDVLEELTDASCRNNLRFSPAVQASRGVAEANFNLICKISDLFQKYHKQNFDHQEAIADRLLQRTEDILRHVEPSTSIQAAPSTLLNSHSSHLLGEGNHKDNAIRPAIGPPKALPMEARQSAVQFRTQESRMQFESESTPENGFGSETLAPWNQSHSCDTSQSKYSKPVSQARDSAVSLADTLDLDAEDRIRKSQAQEVETQVRADTKEDIELEQALQYVRSGRRRRLLLMVSSSLFELTFAVLIITNSILIGVHINWSAENPGQDDPLWFFVAFQFYACLFLIELILRVLAEGCYFFLSPQWHWNYLDIFLVWASLFEVIMEIIAHGSSDESGVQNMSNFRILRIVRVARVMRIFRILRVVRFIRGLRTLLFSIVCTLKSLVWAMLLLVIIIYVFAILFTQAVADYLNPEYLIFSDSFVLQSDEDILHRYFGTLGQSMYTLFQAVAGGLSWGYVIDALTKVNVLCVVTFTMYIAFVYFAVLNVVTGVFCNAAIESAQHDQDLVVQQQLANKQKYVEKVRKLFADIDTDHSGNLTVTEFERHFQQESVQAYFSSLDLDPRDAWTLFKLLDSKGTYRVDIEEFAMGCLRLRGPAKRIDVEKIMYDQQRMLKGLAAFIQLVESQLDVVVTQTQSTAQACDSCELNEKVLAVQAAADVARGSVRTSVLEQFPYAADIAPDFAVKGSVRSDRGSTGVASVSRLSGLFSRIASQRSSNAEAINASPSAGSKHSSRQTS